MADVTVVSRGDFTIRAFLDATIRVALEETFPDLDEGAIAELRERWPSAFDAGAWVAPVRAFLVSRGTRLVLVDTGMGTTAPLRERYGAVGTLVQQLGAAGIAPGDVSDVILTHLHGDHLGGVIDDRGGPARPVFGGAIHYLHEADWRLLHERLTGPRGPVARHFISAVEHVDLRTFTGEQEIAPGLRIIPTPGHTPGHVAVVVGDAGGALLTGDALHHPALVGQPAVRDGHDVDHAVAARTRIALIERAARERRMVGPAHFPSAFIEIARGSSSWVWHPASDRGKPAA